MLSKLCLHLITVTGLGSAEMQLILSEVICGFTNFLDANAR